MFDYNQKPELNITPLVDIMLVLLAILMVTAPIMQYEENINLPQGSKTQKLEINEKIEIIIYENKLIKFNEKSYTYLDFKDNFLLFASKKNKETPIHIKADKNLKYDDVIYVLKSIKNLGFSKVALITDG